MNQFKEAENENKALKAQIAQLKMQVANYEAQTSMNTIDEQLNIAASRIVHDRELEKLREQLQGVIEGEA